MTIGPDDLPPDPFTDGGMQQVICSCTTDAFHLVLTGTTIKVICPACRQAQAEFPRTADTGPHRGWAGYGGDAGMAQRDMLPSAPAAHTPLALCNGMHPPEPCIAYPVVSGAGWDVPSMAELQPPAEPGSGPPPLVPEFPADKCTIVFRGGPYDGQATWSMPDADKFAIAGYGLYRATGEKDGRLRVFAWADG